MVSYGFYMPFENVRRAKEWALCGHSQRLLFSNGVLRQKPLPVIKDPAKFIRELCCPRVASSPLGIAFSVCYNPPE